MNVNICGIPHKVEYVASPFEANVTHFGEIDYVTATIYINKKASKEIQEETLCHEMLHGILEHLGREELAGDEELICSLSNAIYQSFDIKKIGDYKYAERSTIQKEDDDK